MIRAVMQHKDPKKIEKETGTRKLLRPTGIQKYGPSQKLECREIYLSNISTQKHRFQNLDRYHSLKSPHTQEFNV